MQLLPAWNGISLEAFKSCYVRNEQYKKATRKKNNSETLDLCFKIQNFVPRDDYGNSALCSADPEFQVRCFGV